MVVQAKLKIRHHGCVSEKVLGDSRIIHISGDDEHCLSVFKAASEEQLDELLAGNDRVLEPGGLVDRSQNWAVVRCHCPVEGSYIIPIMRESGCSILWPVVESDGHEFYTVLAPSYADFTALLERLELEGEVTVERASNVAAPALDVMVSLSDLTKDLTRNQIEALKAAAHGGYYDTPRKVRADVLAKKMGVSRSTYQEHLQKAEAALMKMFVALVADHPALDEQATKRMGRPRSRLKVVNRKNNGAVEDTR